MKELTKKQLQVVQRLSDGLTIEEIARERNRSLSTLRHHVEFAKERLQARSLAHLVALAMRHGLIQ